MSDEDEKDKDGFSEDARHLLDEEYRSYVVVAVDDDGEMYIAERHMDDLDREVVLSALQDMT